MRMDSEMAADAEALQQMFLSAPLSDDGWATALAALAERTRSRRAQVLGLGPNGTRFNQLTDAPSDYVREFLQIGAHRPEINWRIASSGDLLEIVSERHYAQTRERSGSTVYEQHCRQWEAEYGCQTALVDDVKGFVGLAALRGKAQGKTSRRDRAVFAAAAAHAQTAVRMQHALDHRGAHLLLGMLNTLSMSAFLLDDGGMVHAHTPPADEMVRLPHKDAVVTLRRGRLAACRRDCDARLQHAIGAMLPPKGGSVPMRKLWLRSGVEAAAPGMLCELFSLPRREWDIGFAPRLLLVLRSPGDLAAADVETLQRILGLTRAEGEIALSLANGRDREEIAATRGSSVHTLNTQIKAILRKGDVAREPQIVALVNRLLR